MKHRFWGGLVLAVAALLFTGCVATATAEKANPPSQPTVTNHLKTGGQAITGHTVTETGYIGSSRRQLVEFETAKPVPGSKFYAVVPDAVMAGEVPIAGIYWHGDRPNRRHSLRNSPERLVWEANEVRRDLIAVYRPHSNSRNHWRSRWEVRLQLALVEYLSANFGIERFDLYGHSSGGLVAVAIAQERPHLANMVGLASPKLAVREHYVRHEGGVPNRYHRQYDPINHINKLSSEIPVLIAYDRRDEVVRVGGVLPYVKKAAKLGLRVKLLEVETNDIEKHSTLGELKQELRKPEIQVFLRRD